MRRIELDENKPISKAYLSLIKALREGRDWMFLGLNGKLVEMESTEENIDMVERELEAGASHKAIQFKLCKAGQVIEVREIVK